MWDSRIKQLYKNISTKVSEINIYYAIVEKSAVFLIGNCDKTTKVCLKGGHIIYLIYIFLVLKNKNYVLMLINMQIFIVSELLTFFRYHLGRIQIQGDNKVQDYALKFTEGFFSHENYVLFIVNLIGMMKLKIY